MERSEAIQLGLNTFDTGRPCRNGHLTYRYTQSGACAGCIRGHNADTTGAPLDRERRIAKAALVKMRFRIFAQQLQALLDAAYAAASTRSPALKPEDVRSHSAPTSVVVGTGMYAVMIHPDDREIILEVSKALMSFMKAPVDYSHIHKKLESPDDCGQWPEGDPR